MNTTADFVTLLRDDLGLDVDESDLKLDLDQVAGWDSVHLLSLLAMLERHTGRSLPLADVLSATNLYDVFVLAVGP
jgi:acyl carrier protein